MGREISDSVKEFVQHLEYLARRQDRAALAALRKGLGKAPGDVVEMYPHILPYLPENARPEEELAFYMVGSLFGLYPEPWPNGQKPEDLGGSLGKLAVRLEEDRRRGIERRLLSLLRSNRDVLQAQLRALVNLIRTHAIPIHWPTLVQDLSRWDVHDMRVQKKWARSYVRATSAGGRPDTG
jgi:CRISPR system Cascade subunit CasB